MRVVVFCHSLLSCWNHRNAHFLRGIASELVARGHEVDVYEPHDAASMRSLLEEQGGAALEGFRRTYPSVRVRRYDPAAFDVDEALDGASLVLVHEWNPPELVRSIGMHRARSRNFRLLFHDTNHRAATDPRAMACFDLSHYDGLLAFGDVIREIYLRRGWIQRAWTFHEAADTRVFRPLPGENEEGDLVWIGNWAGDERSAELHEFLVRPANELGLRTNVYGVRYPDAAKAALAAAGITHRGWLPNPDAPVALARHRVTVHIPRRPYVMALPGIPAIRVFEALACGIPLVCSPWDDTEGLFAPGMDYLVARDGSEMAARLRDVLEDPSLARALAGNGLRTIHERHTCAHRVDQLLAIHAELLPSRASSHQEAHA